MANKLTLQQIIKRAGVKQRELAKLLNLDESTISLKIAGKRPMTTKEASVIANRLKISVDQLCSALDFAKCKEQQPPTNPLERAG